MERRGGIQLTQILDKLRDDLRNYYGSLSEVSMGALSAEKVPPKPDELIVYELLHRLNLPLVAGGLLDQPHIWILQYEIIQGILDEKNALENMNRAIEEKQAMQKMIAQAQR